MSEEKSPVTPVFDRATEIVGKAARTLYPENDPRSVEARQAFMNNHFSEALAQARLEGAK